MKFPSSPGASHARLQTSSAKSWLSVFLAGTFALSSAHAQTTAVRANDFLNSMGINTHIHTNSDNIDKVIEALKYTGIRHIRDGGGNTDGLIRIYNSTAVSGVRPGAKTCLLPWNGNPAGTVTVALRVKNGNALLAMEGPNEANNWPFEYEGVMASPSNSLPIARFQKDMFTAIRANTALNGIPIFAPSDIPGAQAQNCGLQYLTIPSGVNCLLPAGTKFAEYANAHNYLCGNGLTGIVDNCAWNAFDPILRSSWNGLSSNFGTTWRGGFPGHSNTQLQTLPRVSTENGWYTSVYPKHNYPLSQTAQARILLNMYLAGFKRGWKYTFIYQMRDQPIPNTTQTESFGIYTVGWAKKTAADCIHNFTTILQDVGSGTPGPLNYSIANRPATTHDLLLQKSNGTFELIVWSERKTGSDSVTVNLGATFPTVRIYNPTAGVSPTQTLSNVSTVALTVSDHPLIIEIPAIRLKAYNPPASSSGDLHEMISDAGATGGILAAFRANAAGDNVVYAFPGNLSPGTYSVRVMFKEGPERPKFQVAMALTGSGVWTNVGSVIDGHATSPVYTKFTVGNYAATATGNYKIRFSVTGRNTAATGSLWNMYVDYIELLKL